MDREVSEPMVNEKVAQLKWQMLLSVDSQSINMSIIRAKTNPWISMKIQYLSHFCWKRVRLSILWKSSNYHRVNNRPILIQKVSKEALYNSYRPKYGFSDTAFHFLCLVIHVPHNNCNYNGLKAWVLRTQHFHNYDMLNFLEGWLTIMLQKLQWTTIQRQSMDLIRC